MPHKPLALVSVLAFGDYMLWNWSLGTNHDVVALVSGLTFPPLLLALLWLLALTLARALGHMRRRTREIERGHDRHRTTGAASTGMTSEGPQDAEQAPLSAPSPTTSSPTASSGKLAA